MRVGELAKGASLRKALSVGAVLVAQRDVAYPVALMLRLRLPLPPSPEILLSLSPPVLRALVATFGGVEGTAANATPHAIARAVFDGRARAKLAKVLASVVGRFSREAGRRAIVEAARAKRDPRAEGWLDVPAGDVAALLAIEIATKRGRERRAAERLLALAGLRLERELGERATYELLATGEVEPKGIERALKGAFGLRVADVWTDADEDGGVRIAVFLRLPTAAGLVVDAARVVARVDERVAVDLVHVRDGGRRLSLTLAVPEHLPTYVRAFDLALRPSFTLRPLHGLTAAKLARVVFPREVVRATLVARRWRRPDGSRVEVRAFDVLATAPDGGGAEEGYVDRATLRFWIGERSVNAFLQLPHRIEISDVAFEQPVRAALAALGLFDPGALPDDAGSLAPYEHGDWRWRGVVGDAGFDALVKSKILVRSLAAHVATHEHRMHGAGYVVRSLAGEPGVEYALAEDRSFGARLVEKKDRVVWRLDLVALADAMRRDLGATKVGPPGAIEIDGVLDLGVVALKSGKIRFVYPMAPAKGWAAGVRKACGIGATPVALVPRGAGKPELIAIELDVEEQLGVKRIGRALGKAAEALGVPEEVEAWRLCEEDVVVEKATQRVWVRGVLVPLTEKPYRFLEYLAGHPGSPRTTKEIGSYASRSEFPDDAARRIRADLERRVRQALATGGADATIADRLIVAEGKQGYRLGLSVRVV